MKVLNLRCAQGHGFEGWFGSESEFEAQRDGGQIACPLCGDKAIVKGLSAPRLNLGAGREAPPAELPPQMSQERTPEGRWMRAVREVLARTEDVGDRFAQEARRIHHGEAQDRGIRGQATPEETVALLEEGIAVLPLPLPAALKETLQ
ncbi:DUF1178 family protein [Pseudacidovorax sp. RU35E]|jgi:hypothetical protein|uniref:DUF1178 family protein n=1 Tax=Pseudacidovorax sp. RU35E TaxID=1907403 RepID=UPI0009575008|nr:DUF1178 family protein [Pseudacidovorax sp. RU35E]SIR79497.1 hypothetical protein SAMN05880557_12211 [Pseudacidovorax sp. RU35E]